MNISRLIYSILSKFFPILNIFGIYDINGPIRKKTSKEFVHYLKNNSSKYFDFIKNLDKDSINNVDLILERHYRRLSNIFVYNNELSETDYKNLSLFKHDLYRNIFTELDFITNKKDYFQYSIFYSHQGLRDNYEKLKNYLKNKDMIDGGSFVNDSALVYKKFYDFNNIYSLEIDKNNIDLGKKVLNRYLKLNKKDPCIFMDQVALWNRDGYINIETQNFMSSKINPETNNKVRCIKIDDYVKEKSIDIGFIKLDIEGSEYNAVMGAENVIKKYKPVLSIAIYHNPKDFFEIKPLIQSFSNDYEFKVIRTHPGFYTEEVFLFCYPKNL